MATFSPRPTEFEFPWFDTRDTYDQSLETAITANETAAGLAQSRADSAFDNAGSAQSTADQAVDDAAAAQSTADTALADAATAQATANAALPLKGPLPDGLITNTVTPGIYFAYADKVTPANGWPVTGGNWMVEVLPGAPTTVTQRITNIGGVHVNGFYYHRVSAGASNGWKFVPAQRIDNTAGLAVYTWDETKNREQLIKYDSGWRDVSTLLTGYVSGRMHARREDQTVTLLMEALTLDTPTQNKSYVLDLAGFANANLTAYLPLGGNQRGAAHTFDVSYYGTHSIRIGSEPALVVNGIASFQVRGSAPTTLPGTAVGTIPFN